MYMKVLFLDIDGVVNSKDTHINNPDEWAVIDPYMAFLVGRISLNTACQVVLSSGWRLHPESVATIEKRVIQLYGCTPELQGKSRGSEIQAWLDEHKDVTAYAILDDDMDAGEGHSTHFFKTTFETGLTTEMAENIIQYLNRKQK